MFLVGARNVLSLFWSVFFGNMFVSVCFSVPNSNFFDFSSSYVHQFPSSLDPSKFCFCPLFQSKILVSVKDFWPWSNIFSSVNVFFHASIDIYYFGGSSVFPL